MDVYINAKGIIHPFFMPELSEWYLTLLELLQNGIVVCDLNCGSEEWWFYTKLKFFCRQSKPWFLKCRKFEIWIDILSNNSEGLKMSSIWLSLNFGRNSISCKVQISYLWVKYGTVCIYYYEWMTGWASIEHWSRNQIIWLCFLCLKPYYCLIWKQLQMHLLSKCNKLLFVTCGSLPFLNIWFMLRGIVIYVSCKIIINVYYITCLQIHA